MIVARVAQDTHGAHPQGTLLRLAPDSLAVSVLFVKGVYWSEDLFESMPGNYYTRHSIGMLGQGVLMFLMMYMTGEDPSHGQYGHYYIQGVGYATVRDVLSWVEPTMNVTSHNSTGGNFTLGGEAYGVWSGGGFGGDGVGGGGFSGGGSADPSHLASSISSPTFCLLLFFAKALSTGLTIGSGASGGIFSPSLYIGATLGGAWGHMVYAALDFVKPLANPKATPFDPIQAVVSGMAGMVGGSSKPIPGSKLIPILHRCCLPAKRAATDDTLLDPVHAHSWRLDHCHHYDI